MVEADKIYNIDCIDGMKQLSNNCIDMILCDLPYGVTDCKWDTPINLDLLWRQLNRIIKPHGAMVFTAVQPFTSKLINSNIDNFKHIWVWNKKLSGSFMASKYMPLRITEDIPVFSNGTVLYHPIMRKGIFRKRGGAKKINRIINHKGMKEGFTNYSDMYFPTNIIEIPSKRLNKLHPTEKPVELFEYLINTYSKEGDIILDPCIGSGTTAEACINTNRRFIGYESSLEYYNISINRIYKVCKQIPNTI